MAIYQILGNIEPYYGLPVRDFQEELKFKPQIMLYFRQDSIETTPEKPPVSGEISIRIPSVTSTTITEAQIKAVAEIIKNKFADGRGFVWHKGKDMISYTDKPKGYKLQLLCKDEAEGRRIIEQILDIRGHSPDWEKMNVKKNAVPGRTYPNVTDKEIILGRARRKPRNRPNATVRFQYALLHVWGIPRPIVLVDRTRRYRDPIIRV